MRQTITESMLLAVVGGAAGIAVAFGATRLILALAFRGSQFVPIDSAPSWPVLVFALLLCVLTGVVFGAAPAWINARANPADALRGAGRATEEGTSLPSRSLVVLQAAVSLVLLAGAGLLTVSLQRLEGQQFGFQTQGRLLVKIDPLFSGYSTEQLETFYRKASENLRRIPGVVNASFSMYSPMQGMNWEYRRPQYSGRWRLAITLLESRERALFRDHWDTRAARTRRRRTRQAEFATGRGHQ
jgi:hypothetical protein